MDFKYRTELEKHELSYNDLPEDAQTGIDNIKEVERAISMLEKNGKKPSAKTLRKIKAMDKWVCYEIYDHVNETDKNDDDAPFEADEIVDDIKDEIDDNDKDDTQMKQVDPKALKIESELSELHSSGKSKYDIEDLQSIAPTCYDVLFDTYEPDEENGIATSNYSLIEGNDEMFHIKKL